MNTTQRILIGWVFLLVCADAAAFGTYRAGSIVLSTNDSVMRVIDAMGQPVYKEAIVNRFGAQVGESWFYRDGTKTIKFVISNGRIHAIEEMRQ